jgi:uncharacterized protein
MLTEQQGQRLICLARQTIEHRLGLVNAPDVPESELGEPSLQERRGVFVTIHKHGALRGCIGSLAATESIVDGVRRHALNAAFHDLRFQPVTEEEASDLVLEVSLLSEPQPLDYNSGVDLVGKLHPGKDGVIIRDPSGASATFLPQVWEQLREPEAFLGHLCRKAGLPATAWTTGALTILTYQVQHFEESR